MQMMFPRVGRLEENGVRFYLPLSSSFPLFFFRESHPVSLISFHFRSHVLV